MTLKQLHLLALQKAVLLALNAGDTEYMKHVDEIRQQDRPPSA